MTSRKLLQDPAVAAAAAEYDVAFAEALAAAEDEDTQQSVWSRSGRAVLRGGWWLGKRASIAGAAITLAPVVVPPLIVLSTIGIALAFPYTVYLASFACTHKVMRSLLPLPPPPPPLSQDGDDDNGNYIQSAEENGGEMVGEEEPTMGFSNGGMKSEEGGIVTEERLGYGDKRVEEEEKVSASGDEGGDEMAGEEEPVMGITQGNEEAAAEEQLVYEDKRDGEEEKLSSVVEGGDAGMDREEKAIEMMAIGDEEEPVMVIAGRDGKAGESGEGSAIEQLGYGERRVGEEEQVWTTGDEGGIGVDQEEKVIEMMAIGDNKAALNSYPVLGMVPEVGEIEIELEMPFVTDEKRSEGYVEMPKEARSSGAAVSEAKEAVPEGYTIEGKPSAVEGRGNDISFSVGLEEGRNQKEEEEQFVESIATGDGKEVLESEKKEDGVGCFGSEDERNDETMKSEEEKSAAIGNQGGVELVREEKPMEVSAIRDEEMEENGREEDQAETVGAQEPPPSSYHDVEMVPKSREIAVEPEHPSLLEGFTHMPEKVKQVEGTGEERDERRGESANAAVMDFKEALPEEHTIEGDTSAVEQSGNEGGIDMVDETAIRQSLEDGGNREGVEMVGEEKPTKSSTTEDVIAVRECEENKDSGHQYFSSAGNKHEAVVEKLSPIGNQWGTENVCEEKPMEILITRDEGAEEKRREDEQAGALSAQELLPSSYPIIGMVPTVREIAIEPTRQGTEHPDLHDMKWNEGCIQMPEKEKPIEGTGKERVENKGEAVNAVIPEVKESLQEEHKIEGEPSAVDRRGNEGGLHMVEEERLAEEQKQVDRERKEEKGTGDAAPEMELPNTAHPSAAVEFNECKSEGEPSGLSSEYASAVEDHSSDVAETESRSSIEHGMHIRLGPEREAEASFDDEVLFNEQKIWEQILAIRTIVGYKAALCSSLVGELRALYLFTGVEPPLSFIDASDLDEVSEKLQFLKSVIGVI